MNILEKQQKEENKLSYNNPDNISQNLLEDIKQRYNITEQLTRLLKEREETYDLNYSEITQLSNRSPKIIQTVHQRVRKKRG